ncbi:MAG: hypothetical protein H6853_08940 [Rhodospirillales bacterium]|nr:hypothetical protein [Alphaproteobacteria bacterium]USO03630.1 MAG: hypothetical protein H6853_08940 [Rhodospirillales bacterium]
MVVIISRIKDFLAQAFARGACREWLLRRKGQNFGLGTALALSLFLVGSCNNANIGLFSFSGKTADLSAMNKGQMMRYAQDVQAAIARTPENLMKLHGEEVRLILAGPDLERKDLPSIVWQYRNAECVLDVYFTAAGDSADAENVSHYEFRYRDTARAGEAPVAGSCMRGLYEDRRNRIAESFRQIFALYIQKDPQAG